MKSNKEIVSWIISDGTKGMENQSIAVAKLLNKKFNIVKYNPPFFLRSFPILANFYSNYVGRRILTEKLAPSYIITTGKRMAGVSVALIHFEGKSQNYSYSKSKIIFQKF